jgi:hypothetical protein
MDHQDHQDHHDHSVLTSPVLTPLSLQTVITAITAIANASADLKPVVRPSGGGKQARVRGIPTLGPRKFQQRRLSVPPPPKSAIYQRPPNSVRLTTRASPKTSPISADCPFMPSIALWSHRFGRLCKHEQLVLPSTP